MAFDSSPGPDSLTEATIDGVRAAIAAYIDAPEDGEPLRGALHLMAVEARAASMLPERLLIVLKEIWYDLPQVRALEEPTDRVRLLQRVVSMCIREYFGQ